MIKKLNSLSILFMVTVVMVLLMLLTIYHTKDDADDNALLFPALYGQLSQINTIKFKSSHGEFTLTKKGEDWYIPQRFNYLADFNEVKRILIDISETKILEGKTAKVENLAQLGLSSPGKQDSDALQITMMNGNSPISGIVIGHQRHLPIDTGPRQFYVRRAGENHAWLAEGYLQISPVMLNWVKTEIMNIARERMAAIDIIQPNGETASLINLGHKDKFGTPTQRENTVFKYEQLGYDIAGTLTHLRMEDVKPLKGFERGNAEVVKAVFKTFDGLEITTHTSFNNGVYFVTIHSSYDADAVQAAPEDIKQLKVLKSADEVKQEVAKLNKQLSPWVYRVSGFVGTNLMRAKSDMVSEPDKVIPMPPTMGGFGPAH